MTLDMREVVFRPGIKDFLWDLSEIANIAVWSTMRKCNAEVIVKTMFRGITESVFVYGSEQCDFMKFRNRQGKLEIYKWRENKKRLFLKPLSKVFKSRLSKDFTLNNTIMVDTFVTQTFMNYDKNVVLFKPWDETKDLSFERMFMAQFLPWIRRLHSRKGVNLRDFRTHNPIGEQTLYQRACDTLWTELMSVREESDRLFEEWNERHNYPNWWADVVHERKWSTGEWFMHSRSKSTG